MFTRPTLPLLVFTDLDGTLLDHDDYSLEPARPTLARLAGCRIPLIPTTSKTLAEIIRLNEALPGNPQPCIIENGGALCLPPGYFDGNPAMPLHHGYQIARLARPYGQILDTLSRVRQARGFRFRGFSDMSCEEVVDQTGLSMQDAARARQRLCSEPLLWEDTPEAREEFENAVARYGLHTTQGGRFLHVMDATDKGRAMAQLCALYRQAGFADFTTVALGDSPNDLQMLEHADIAVAVRRKDGSVMSCHGRLRTLQTTASGPAGWNSAMQEILDEFTAPTADTKSDSSAKAPD